MSRSQLHSVKYAVDYKSMIGVFILAFHGTFLNPEKHRCNGFRIPVQPAQTTTTRELFWHSLISCVVYTGNRIRQIYECVRDTVLNVPTISSAISRGRFPRSNWCFSSWISNPSSLLDVVAYRVQSVAPIYCNMWCSGRNHLSLALCALRGKSFFHPVSFNAVFAKHKPCQC